MPYTNSSGHDSSSSGMDDSPLLHTGSSGHGSPSPSMYGAPSPHTGSGGHGSSSSSMPYTSSSGHDSSSPGMNDSPLLHTGSSGHGSPSPSMCGAPIARTAVIARLPSAVATTTQHQPRQASSSYQATKTRQTASANSPRWRVHQAEGWILPSQRHRPGMRRP